MKGRIYDFAITATGRLLEALIVGFGWVLGGWLVMKMLGVP